MPRTARRNSAAEYMHIVIRGNSKQILFEDRQDYLFFLSILRRFSRETQVLLCAYCLMDNHVHLLARDEYRQVSLFMKKLEISYTTYFNKKYERCGHLFQNRFLSEAVENERYLLTVFRYILKNPQKAGICSASDYEWSSFSLYGRASSIVDTKVFRELIGDYQRYESFIAEEEQDSCLEYEPFKRDDSWAKEVISQILHVESGTELLSYEKRSRDQALRLLRDKGLSVRQVERLTGIGRGVVQRIWKSCQGDVLPTARKDQRRTF